MWKIISGLIISIVFLNSCATLNQNEIKTAPHKLIEEQQLLPMLDYFGERLDILRNKTEVRGGANSEGTEDMPYHDAGFYLGNGLFYDLNGNLCMLPLYPFFDLKNDFVIHKKYKSSVINSSYSIIKTDSLVSIKADNKIGFTKNYEVKVNDSLIIFVKGKLMKMELLKKPSGSFYYKRALANEDIHKTKNGFSIKKLLSKDYYTVKGNEISLADQVKVKYRENMIEVYQNGWSKPLLKYQILVNENSMIIYDTKYRGFKLEKQGEVLKVYKNQKIKVVYEMQP
jgi:hypothetical protein